MSVDPPENNDKIFNLTKNSLQKSKQLSLSPGVLVLHYLQ